MIYLPNEICSTARCKPSPRWGRCRGTRRMRVRRFREQNGELPYCKCKWRTLIRRLRRHLPHLGEGFKMRRLSIDLLSFVRTLNHNLSYHSHRTKKPPENGGAWDRYPVFSFFYLWIRPEPSPPASFSTSARVTML